MSPLVRINDYELNRSFNETGYSNNSSLYVKNIKHRFVLVLSKNIVEGYGDSFHYDWDFVKYYIWNSSINIKSSIRYNYTVQDILSNLKLNNYIEAICHHYV